MFIDRAKITVEAGKGGNGIVAWRREKYLPKGGPYGGDGGRGGDVIFLCDPNLSSLDWFVDRHTLRAENGHAGGSNNRTGRNGRNLVLRVPPGTVITDSESGEILADITLHNQSWQACRGGKGGRGNSHFKSPTRRAPNFATMGSEGEVLDLHLELKLIADVGFVGFPNAGKSTLLRELSNARVKVAAYPFTTLHPNLGSLAFEKGAITLADIPGIIEGAHRNRGLGLKFLRHIERTKLLLFILDASGIEGRTPLADLTTLFDELRNYSYELLQRPALYVLNKVDCEESQQNIDEFFAHAPIDQSRVLQISAQEGTGIGTLKKMIFSLMEEYFKSHLG